MLRHWGPIALVLLFFAAIAVFVGAAWGQVTSLTCTRTGAGEPVNCIKNATLFGLIPLSNEEIHGLQRASVAECDWCEDVSYRVELITPQGTIPATSIYDGTPGALASAQGEANRINAFISSETDTHDLVITNGERNAVIFLIGLTATILYFAWWLRK